MNLLWKRIRPLLSMSVRFMHISYLEAKSDYQGTKLGVLWIPVSTLVFTLLLGLVFHAGGPMPVAQFFLFVLAGYVSWNFISDSISGSTSIIQTGLDFAIHSNLTLAGLFGKNLADRMFEYGLNVAVLLLSVLVVSPTNIGLPVLLFVPLLALLSITSLGVSYLVNLLTLFVPDLANVIKTAVRFLFFATPIFWTADERTDIRGLLESYNPAAYYLNMSRQVFGIEPLDWNAWAIGTLISLLVGLAGYIAYQRSHAFVRNIR